MFLLVGVLSFGVSSSSRHVSKVIRGSPVCDGERGHFVSSSSGMSPRKIASRASSEITGVILRFDLISLTRSETGDFCLTRTPLDRCLLLVP